MRKIFSMRDVPKEDVDEAIARHTLERRGKPVEDQPRPGLDPEFLKKYIQHARGHYHPVMTDPEAQAHAVEFYKGLRQKSMEMGTVALTHRQFQSILRLAEARAKARLSNTVTKEDVEVAINLLEQSLKNVGVDASTGKADIDGILTGKFRSQGTGWPP
jgi:replicative DNA helicase Mcm